jgi:hypothetical protein
MIVGLRATRQRVARLAGGEVGRHNRALRMHLVARTHPLPATRVVGLPARGRGIGAVHVQHDDLHRQTHLRELPRFRVRTRSRGRSRTRPCAGRSSARGVRHSSRERSRLRSCGHWSIVGKDVIHSPCSVHAQIDSRLTAAVGATRGAAPEPSPRRPEERVEGCGQVAIWYRHATDTNSDAQERSHRASSATRCPGSAARA